MEEALSALTEGGARISYRPDQLPEISFEIDTDRRPTVGWLDLFLRDTELIYENGAAGLLIVPNASLYDQSFSLFGMVSDAVTGERLISATVQLTDVNSGTNSNEYGFYTLTEHGGRHRLRATYIGYLPLETEIVLRADTQINLQLIPNNELPQIIVTAMESGEGEARYFETGTRIGRTEVSQLGGPLGEDDPLQLARLLPGVTSGAEGIGGMLIRGSEAGQNLILLDGVPVYGLSHAGGLFSIFSNQAIRRIDLYKDALPARFGGRVGGVLDVHTRDGNLYENELTVGSSLLSAQVAAEGPIRVGESSFLLTGRYFWASNLIRRYSEQYKKNRGRKGSLDYDVYDINFKLNQRAGKRGRIYLSLYSGLDDYSNNSWQGDTIHQMNEAGTLISYQFPSARRESVHWGNTVAALRYNHVFSERTFGNFRLSYSDLQTASSFERSDSTKILTSQDYEGWMFSGDYQSSIRSLGLAFDGQHSMGNATSLRFGAELNDHKFAPSLFNDTVALSNYAGEEANEVFTPIQVAAYGSWEGRRGNVYYRLGLRGNIWTDRGKTYTSFSPRIMLSGPLTANIDWQLSYDRTVQPIHLLSSFVIGIPSDLWVPSSTDIAPATSPQVSGKLSFTPAPSWLFTTAAYYKAMKGLIAYSEGQQTSEQWRNQLSRGSGKAYGLEISLQRNRGNLRGWLSYTLARSERTFDPLINQGRPFPFRYDRRHSVNLLLIYQLGERTTLTGSWRFESGLAYSMSEILLATPIDYGPPNSVLTEERNGFRMPVNHRLDVNLHSVLSSQNSRFTHAIDVGLYNVYNRRNPIYYEVRPEYTPAETGAPVGRDQFYKIFIAPLLPTLSYHLTFSSGG
ncbi:carboxypeptidase-like regulatory domain-containing protein [Lewinella sp. IMCC34191]|uniref:TonB-dependent receptor n=1 Tax=Lewinella sp. IMCC34191 TaxID=2259172 RepID=UPI0018E579AC|nr:carboxypeptidase-like regulatory domain-containing protein [Lewinella sp. IMCC34191]